MYVIDNILCCRYNGIMYVIGTILCCTYDVCCRYRALMYIVGILVCFKVPGIIYVVGGNFIDVLVGIGVL